MCDVSCVSACAHPAKAAIGLTVEGLWFQLMHVQAYMLLPYLHCLQEFRGLFMKPQSCREAYHSADASLAASDFSVKSQALCSFTG